MRKWNTEFDRIIDQITRKAIADSLDEISAALTARFAEHLGDSAWLVEMIANDDAPAPRWWHPEHGWTFDANKALRFAREQDAADYIKAQRSLHAKATSHMWMRPPEDAVCPECKWVTKHGNKPNHESGCSSHPSPLSGEMIERMPQEPSS